VFVFGKHVQTSVMCMHKALKYGAPVRCFIQLGSSLTLKQQTRLERVARDKHSST
jgi:hypothetical protein